MNAAEEAWVLLKQEKTNQRGLPERGTVTETGLTAYPVMTDNRKNTPLDDFPITSDEVEVFRNISSSPFLSPGFIGNDRVQDRGVLSVMPRMRGMDGKTAFRTAAVANAFPLRDAYMKRAGKQRGSISIDVGSKTRPKRGQHMVSRGRMTLPEMMRLFGGEHPESILGMDPRIVLGRNRFGDAAMFMRTPSGGLQELPYVAYTWADLIDPNVRGKERWDKENLAFRTDDPTPWRTNKGFTFPAGEKLVTGSIDPILRIPDPTSPSGYIQYTDRLGHTYAGVPIPPRFKVGRGVATGAHGLYFDPADIADADSWNILEQALGGNIVQRSEDAVDVAWLIIKMD